MLDIEVLNNQLLKNFIKSNFEGFDPYDYLNSKIINYTPIKYSKFLKLLITQFGKKFPFDIRKFLLIQKSRNPKGVALIILGLIENYKRTNNDYYINLVKPLIAWLLENRCDQLKWKHNCWGYNFEWQAKAFNVPFGYPNIVSTYFVSKAIFDYAKIIKDEELEKESLDSAYFINNFLYSEKNAKYNFKYVPNSETLVFNANLFGCHWCLIAGIKYNDLELINKSQKAIKYTIENQLPDGSWTYGDRNHHKWIDGFHTGYNLEILSKINKILKNDEIKNSILKGYNYYFNTFILKDGKVKYYNNSIYPLDVHSYSQAILTILEIDRSQKEMLTKIIKSLFLEMYLKKEERFIYQKNRFYQNKINYFRWTQAWAYYALSKYNKYLINNEQD